MRCLVMLGALAGVAAAPGPADWPGPTVAAIHARDAVVCGVRPDTPGFSTEQDGTWHGIDADYCRALAVAVLGDPGRTRFVAITDATRITLLMSGALDVLMGKTALTFGRSAYLGLEDVAVTVWRDGQPYGLLTRTDDPYWRKIVFWTDNALKLAEQLGIRAGTANDTTVDHATAILLGTEGQWGSTMGLDPAWARNALLAVGNYGEIYARAFGDTPRGPNALVRDGGVVAPLPFE